LKRSTRIVLWTAAGGLVTVVVALALSVWYTRSERGVLARRALRSEIVGCYALYGNKGQRVDTTYQHASPLVRLDSTLPSGVVATFAGMFRVLIAFDSLGRPRGTTSEMFPPTWSADSLSDTIRVSFGDGFSGAEFSLAAPPRALDTLWGRAAEHWDSPPSTTRRGSAYALRVPCPIANAPTG
jgi:hypothetical protein